MTLLVCVVDAALGPGGTMCQHCCFNNCLHKTIVSTPCSKVQGALIALYILTLHYGCGCKPTEVAGQMVGGQGRCQQLLSIVHAGNVPAATSRGELRSTYVVYVLVAGYASSICKSAK